MKKLTIYSLFVFIILLSSCGKKTETTAVQRKDIVEMVFATGALIADDEYSLTAQSEGYLTAVNFEEGNMVNAGKLMAVIDNKPNEVNAVQSEKLLRIAKNNATANAPLLQQVKANMAAAQTKLQQDELQAERYKKLYESNSVAKLEYENTQLALSNSKAALNVLQEQYNNLLVQANQQVVVQQQQAAVNNSIVSYNRVMTIVGGKIYKKKKQLGDYVRKGDVIAVIGNPGKIYARLNIDESNMWKIKIDEPVIIQLNTNKQKSYKAVIGEILPAFDEATQSFYVKAFFSDTLDFSISGTQLQANIITGEKKQALVIPRKYMGYGNKVMLKDKSIAVIKPGIISTDWIEVLVGLKEGQTILMELNK
jgi:multidrug efflux pump subunit AcrA (membrane-fusion protein)